MLIIGLVLFIQLYIAFGLLDMRLLWRINKEGVRDPMHIALSCLANKPVTYWSMTLQVPLINSWVSCWQNGRLVTQISQRLSEQLEQSWKKTGAQKGCNLIRLPPHQCNVLTFVFPTTQNASHDISFRRGIFGSR